MFTSTAVPAAATGPAPMTSQDRRVVFASSLGTVFEWYDFYLYGSLAPILAAQFFSGLDAASALIFALLAFAAGFIVRPFGALLFGRLGDMIGRKYTFLVTMLIMGLSTFVVGLLPGQAAIGVAAPVILVLLRLLQGLALGGEYGGAATYVAEHAPAGRRGAYTGWMQTTATLGLLLSLAVILGTRAAIGEQAFAAWGWRIPFLLSIVLLVISTWIRLSMEESPVFRKMKEAGKAPNAPLAEALGRWRNLKRMILALFGLVAGQAVVWYTGHFHALFFLTEVLKVDGRTAHVLMAAALLLGAPFFVAFGSLSDRIGRKPVILAGCLIAALAYFPLFKALTEAANPDLAAAQAKTQVVVVADPDDCSLQFNPIGTAKFTSDCDLARQALAARSVNYVNEASAPGTPAAIRIGPLTIDSPVTAGLPPGEARWREAEFRKAVAQALDAAGFPVTADPAKMNRPLIVGILLVLVILVAMVYGPIAAMLVEMFPTRIRYTATSLPYHVGNGWFGGLLPAIAFAIVAQTGNVYSGLWYPIVIAAASFAIGTLFLRETRGTDLSAGD
ncbi:MAG: MFS transporter [Piscinibacter sp.]|uniref:MFS transporter n=1 Tax=Piscinibacter sp. TaxID=1903157 RepID=UPI003D148DBA